jgi:hypothetical protein
VHENLRTLWTSFSIRLNDSHVHLTLNLSRIGKLDMQQHYPVSTHIQETAAIDDYQPS